MNEQLRSVHKAKKLGKNNSSSQIF